MRAASLSLSSFPLLLLSILFLSSHVSLTTARPTNLTKARDNQVDQRICDGVPEEYHAVLGCNDPNGPKLVLFNDKHARGIKGSGLVLKKRIRDYTITIRAAHNSYAGPKVGIRNHFNLVVHQDIPPPPLKPGENPRKKPKKAHVHNFHISLYDAPGKTCAYIWDSVPRRHPQFPGPGKVVLDTCVGPGDIGGAVSAITSKMSATIRDLVSEIDLAAFGIGLASVIGVVAATVWQLTGGALL